MNKRRIDTALELIESSIDGASIRDIRKTTKDR
jgi:hypothetical protein